MATLRLPTLELSGKIDEDTMKVVIPGEPELSDMFTHQMQAKLYELKVSLEHFPHVNLSAAERVASTFKGKVEDWPIPKGGKDDIIY